MNDKTSMDRWRGLSDGVGNAGGRKVEFPGKGVAVEGGGCEGNGLELGGRDSWG